MSSHGVKTQNYNIDVFTDVTVLSTIRLESLEKTTAIIDQVSRNEA